MGGGRRRRLKKKYGQAEQSVAVEVKSSTTPLSQQALESNQLQLEH